MASEVKTPLIRLCIEAAAESADSVEKWRLQRRTLERLPPHLAQALLHRLIRRRLATPSLLEVFKSCIEEIDLRGENYVDAEWMAYIGSFRFLHVLNMAGCPKITNSAIWPLAGIASLKELDLSKCSRVTDAGIKHILSISTLKKLCVSETGLTASGVEMLSSLKNLSVLDLGGLPVTDSALSSLQALTMLEYLDLWGSNISNSGATVFKMFPKLSFLNVAWTHVTKLPNLASLTSLNMSNCTVDSIFERNGQRSSLAKLMISGAKFLNESEAFFHIDLSSLSFMDASNSSLCSFLFLPSMTALEHLDLSFSIIGDDLTELIASVGANLRVLNLSNTRISSAGMEILAGRVPNLEVISLSHTFVDDTAILHISRMPLLKIIELSHTNIKGVIRHIGDEGGYISSLQVLQRLNFLERLDLEETQLSDFAITSLSNFQTLSHISLKCVSLTDISLQHLASLTTLVTLGIRDAVVTNGGLESFNPCPKLELLDLSGCWLLSKDAILLFCKYHPQIEVRHEAVPCVPSSQNLKTSPLKHKRGKLHAPRATPRNDIYIDQRLKYSRDELLALCSSSLSVHAPGD